MSGTAHLKHANRLSWERNIEMYWYLIGYGNPANFPVMQVIFKKFFAMGTYLKQIWGTNVLEYNYLHGCKEESFLHYIDLPKACFTETIDRKHIKCHWIHKGVWSIWGLMNTEYFIYIILIYWLVKSFYKKGFSFTISFSSYLLCYFNMFF